MAQQRERRELELEEGARTGGASADWEKQRKKLLCWAERSGRRAMGAREKHCGELERERSRK